MPQRGHQTVKSPGVLALLTKERKMKKKGYSIQRPEPLTRSPNKREVNGRRGRGTQCIETAPRVKAKLSNINREENLLCTF